MSNAVNHPHKPFRIYVEQPYMVSGILFPDTYQFRDFEDAQEVADTYASCSCKSRYRVVMVDSSGNIIAMEEESV